MRLYRIIALFMTVLFLSLGFANAEGTTLSVRLYGMKYADDGQWESQIISGTFQVYQDQANVGILDSDVREHNQLTLPGDTEVSLLPETIQDGYQIDPEGYQLAITPGIDNTVHILAYASEGLFQILGTPNQTYHVYPFSESGDQEDEDDDGCRDFHGHRREPLGAVEQEST